MAAPQEMLLTSESSGQLWNTCVWDLHSGTSLMSFKGYTSSPKTLCTIGEDYIMSAVANKPLIHVWKLQKREQLARRMVCSGVVSALCSSHDGAFCAAAVHEKLHIWQTCTGHLIAVLTGHYQAVRCLKFTDDSSHLISGGDDNLVLAWFLPSVITDEVSSVQGSAPRHMWSSHSLPITDLHVGSGGVYSRVYTSSLDQTCRIWDLASGELLVTLSFDSSITSIVTDYTESRLFAGSSNGNIYQFNLFEKPARTERHISEEDKSVMVFKGHSKQVSCLAVSLEGDRLVSGSQDFNVKIWDVASFQCMRTTLHKGAITNVMLLLPPRNLQEAKPLIQLQTFLRHLHNSQNEEESSKDVLPMMIINPTLVATSGVREGPAKHAACAAETQGSRIGGQADLQKKVLELSKMNMDLYHFALKEIMQSENK